MNSIADYKHNYFSNSIEGYIKESYPDQWHSLQTDDILEDFVNNFADKAFQYAQSLYNNDNVPLVILSEKTLIEIQSQIDDEFASELQD